MSALRWILVVVSWLASLSISGATLVLASMFRGSGDTSDRTIGLGIGVGGVLFLLLPGAGTWLLVKTGRTTLGTVLLISAVVAGFAAGGLVWGAIEAAARP